MEFIAAQIKMETNSLSGLTGDYSEDMEYFIICISALIVAALTLLAGFGLGTLLLPAFALFFPVEVAVAATAVVHLLNNLFKVYLVGRSADKKILLLFAVPAAIFAMIGAWLLNFFASIPAIYQYSVGARTMQVRPVNLVIAVLIIIFAFLEFIPKFNQLSFKSGLIPFGGALSGFFGGLSGHQGALRAAFLVRVGLEKKTLIGTMILSAVIVDISRLLVYGFTFFERDFRLLYQQGGHYLVLAGTLAAFTGSFIASRFLEKITLQGLKIFIAVMLVIIAFALGLGWV